MNSIIMNLEEYIHEKHVSHALGVICMHLQIEEPTSPRAYHNKTIIDILKSSTLCALPFSYSFDINGLIFLSLHQCLKMLSGMFHI